MQIRNNYDILWKKTDGTQVGTGIFNGDIGVITEIDLNAELLTVVFDDRQAEYDFDMLRELELAYAMTVHKSQGSEYQAVVLAAWSCAPNLRTRRVLYTAITRARKLLVVVGREDILQTMTENQRQSRRYSGLKLPTAGEGAMRALYPSPGSALSPKVRPVRQAAGTGGDGSVRRLPPGGTGVFRRRNVHSLCDRLDGGLPL